MDDPNYFTFTTTSLSSHLPLFLDKVGADIPLKLIVSQSNMNVTFLEDKDTDVTLRYVVCLDWNKMGLNGEKDEQILYDEINMITKINLDVSKDVVNLKIKENQIVSTKSIAKDRPTKDTLKLSKRDYRAFMSSFEETMSELEKWINSKYIDGIPMPFGIDEFNTKILFRKRAMNLMFEVENDSGEFFEEELWDQKALSDLKHGK